MKEMFFVVCDGLKGLPEVVADVWPLLPSGSAVLENCEALNQRVGAQRWMRPELRSMTSLMFEL